MIGGRGISWRAWAVLCTLGAGGCDYIVGIDHVDFQDARGVTGDTRADGPDDGANRGFDATTACASPILYDSFGGDAACSPWGVNSPYETSSMVSEANGVLTMQLTDTGGGGQVGGCKSASTYSLGSGVTAIINEAVAGAGAFTVLELHPADVQIAVQGGQLVFQTAGGTPIGTAVTYMPTMRWWRMRFTGTAIVGEYSSNGTIWSNLGARTVSATPVGIELTAGATTASWSGKAVFDDLMICP